MQFIIVDLQLDTKYNRIFPHEWNHECRLAKYKIMEQAIMSVRDGIVKYEHECAARVFSIKIEFVRHCAIG